MVEIGVSVIGKTGPGATDEMNYWLDEYNKQIVQILI